MLRLMEFLCQLPPPPDPLGIYGRFREYKRKFVESLASGDLDTVEEHFLELYCHVHGHQAPYTPEERARIDEIGGYWCHAGGISPLLKAGEWIHRDTISADYGAGNGLQGLLLQKLYPHKRTVQIEISSRMVELGKLLQDWMGISRDRVEWVVDDVRNISPQGMSFIYMYRPVKPVGEGEAFYVRFAEEISRGPGRKVIFSIADCLKDYLPPEFKMFYYDGHLACFKRDQG